MFSGLYRVQGYCFRTPPSLNRRRNTLIRDSRQLQKRKQPRAFMLQSHNFSPRTPRSLSVVAQVSNAPSQPLESISMTKNTAPFSGHLFFLWWVLHSGVYINGVADTFTYKPEKRKPLTHQLESLLATKTHPLSTHMVGSTASIVGITTMATMVWKHSHLGPGGITNRKFYTHKP